jgi:hypothetical protein
MHELPNKRDLDLYLDSYNSLPFEDIQEVYRRKSLIKFLEEKSFDIATEIGCGRTSLFEFWHPAELAQTIEPISNLVENAKKSISPDINWIGINARAEDAMENHKIEQADVTILSSILHEVENPSELLNTAKLLTKKGGQIFIIVTNKNSLHRILGVHLGVLGSLDAKTSTEILMQQSHGAYSETELHKEVKDAGLRLLSMHSLFPKLFSHNQMSKLIKTQVISIDFLDTLESLSDYLPGLGSELLAIAINDYE